jgi:exportin-1
MVCIFISLGLTMHATILAYMFSLVELGRITVPLGPSHDNTLYVQEFVASLLRAAFPHLSDNQIKITVQGLFNLDQDIPAFKEHLRDFLVQIRVKLLLCHTLCSKLVFMAWHSVRL